MSKGEGMPQNCFIGLDQGSSSSKALAISEEGQVLFQAKRPVPSPFPEEDRIEYAPLGILKSVEDVLAEAVQSVRMSGFVPAGIGLSCQRSSCLLWNESTGEPLSPVISWRDRRGAAVVEQLTPEAESVFETTGLPLTPYYSASKFRWILDNSPAAGKESGVFGTLSSFLVQRLTRAKRAVADHTHAARTQLMNIHTLAWDPMLLDLFGLSSIRLPDIVPVIQEFGQVSTAAGPVPLLASAGDQQSAMTGLGVLEPGDGGINYGTGGFLMVHTGKDLVPAKGLMASVHYSTEHARHYLIEGSVNAAGDALEWLRSRMRLFADYGEVDDLCWQAATDVVAFIGLNGTGAPHWERAISSSIHGLSSAGTAADIVRATVESIAFFIKDIAGAITAAGRTPRSYAVSGGLSALSYLVQVQSDILGSDLRVRADQEVSALGAAFLAGMAHGTWTAAHLKKMGPPAETVSPRHNAGAEKRYRRWKELHRMTKMLDEI